MLLIDALHINNSGGKILLDYLIESIEQSNIEVFYLLDNRVRDDYTFLKKNKVIFLKANFKNRFLFYVKNKNLFKKVFCFGNIPPPIKLKVKTFTYLHNKLFLSIPKQLPFKDKLVFFIKSQIVKYLSKNTDLWIVQTTLMKQDLLKNFPSNSNLKVMICPFYAPLISYSKDKVKRKKNSFLYVSTYNPHKNFENLIDGFKLFYDTHRKGELHLTLKDENLDIIKKIKSLVSKSYPIFNHGFINQTRLVSIYKQSEFIVYPSLIESFGLGIVEGIENGCKVIGSDLPYTYAVCKPSINFNPKDILSVFKAFEKTLESNSLIKTEQLVFNEIESLINILKKD